MFLLIKKSVGYLNRMRLGGWAAIVSVEILIIVVGIYIGAGIADIQQQNERRERHRLIMSALTVEIRPFVEQGGPMIEIFQTEFENWLARYASGDRPPPFFVAQTNFLARPHPALWDALLTSGGLELLPVDLITDVADFYARTDRMVERYNRIDRFAQDNVLPFLDEETEQFYLQGRSELKSMYQIYLQELEALLDYASETVTLGHEIQENFDQLPVRGADSIH